MSKKHKHTPAITTLHPEAVKRVEEAATPEVVGEPDASITFSIRGKLDDSFDPDKIAKELVQPHEEYLVQEVHYGDLQSRLNQLAAEGRWRLHTVNLSGTYCRYVLVRSV